MLGWTIRILLILLVIRLVLRFLRGVYQGMTVPPAQETRSVALVKDPVCGTYLPRAKALVSHAGGDTQFFCSAGCRDQYEGRGRGRTRA
jgi:uncharacterized protein